MTPEEQEALARELYATMAKTDTWDTGDFVRMRRRVIEECPDTKKTQESLWRLSNLYLTGTGRDPDYPEIIRLLERLVERYPESPLVYGARQRLLVAYENTGDMKKARALYEEQLASDKDLPKSGDYATCFSSMRRASPPRESRKRPGKSTGRSWHSIPRPSPGSWTSCGTTCRHWTNRRRTSAEAG